MLGEGLVSVSYSRQFATDASRWVNYIARKICRRTIDGRGCDEMFQPEARKVLVNARSPVSFFAVANRALNIPGSLHCSDRLS